MTATINDTLNYILIVQEKASLTPKILKNLSEIINFDLIFYRFFLILGLCGNFLSFWAFFDFGWIPLPFSMRQAVNNSLKWWQDRNLLQTKVPTEIGMNVNVEYKRQMFARKGVWEKNTIELSKITTSTQVRLSIIYKITYYFLI